MTRCDCARKWRNWFEIHCSLILHTDPTFAQRFWYRRLLCRCHHPCFAICVYTSSGPGAWPSRAAAAVIEREWEYWHRWRSPARARRGKQKFGASGFEIKTRNRRSLNTVESTVPGCSQFESRWQHIYSRFDEMYPLPTSVDWKFTFNSSHRA